jgi:hypothetical protein
MREDIERLTNLVKTNTIDLKRAKVMASNALMHIPKIPDMVKTSTNMDNDSLGFFKEEFCLWDFTFLMEDTIYGTFNYNEGKDTITIIYYTYDKYKKTYHTSKVVIPDINMGGSFSNCSISIDGKDYKKMIEKILTSPIKDHRAEEAFDLIKESIILNIQNVCIIRTWMEMNNANDRYLIQSSVKRRPLPPKLNLSIVRQLATDRILYLDKLPEEPGQFTCQGTRGPVSSHQRRGYYVTLNAERFSKHPKYKVENGIYRKPAWVGPRSVEIQGTTYTVLDK